MSLENRRSIPLLDQLVPDGIEVGTVFNVEFDPDSEWLAVATTIAAKYIQAGGRVAYLTMTRPPEAVMKSLDKLGVDTSAAIKEHALTVDDWYTATLSGGRIATEQEKTVIASEPIDGGLRLRSLRVADLSVEWLKDMKDGFKPYDVVETWPAGALTIVDSHSDMMRFNEENAFLEFVFSRGLPNERRAKRIRIGGFVRGVHAESFYRRIEAASDGVIDVRVMEQEGVTKNLLKLRSLKGQPHDNRWHEIVIKTNGEAILTS